MTLGINQLIESIGKAVSEAQLDMEKKSLCQFFEYFEERRGGEEDADNVELRPITAKILMPRSDDITKTIDVEVPLLSLVHHNQVSLDKVSVKMKVNLYMDDNNEIRADMNMPVSGRTASANDTGEETADQARTHEIELVYQVSDKSEGLSRVVQNITKTI